MRELKGEIKDQKIPKEPKVKETKVKEPKEPKVKKESKKKDPFETNLSFEPCSVCDKKSLPVAPNGVPGKLMFVGIQPGFEEEKKGLFFCGESGQYLQSELLKIGIDPEQDCWFTNVMKCRCVSDNNRTREPEPSEMKICGEFLKREIQQVKPKLIVLLGDSPLTFFFNKSQISRYRGLVLDKGDFKFFVTFNPAHIIREKSDSTDRRLFLQDIKRIYNIYNGVQSSDSRKVEKKICRNRDEVKNALNDLGMAYRLSLDIETYAPKHPDIKKTALDPFAPGFLITTLSLSFKIGDLKKAYCFPLEHPQSSLVLEETLEMLKEFFKVKRFIVGQNIKFDLKCLLVHFGMNIKCDVFDVLNAHTNLVGTYGAHNLERLSLDYLGVDPYKHVLGSKEDKGSVMVDLEPLASMNMDDCINTLDLAILFEEDLKKENLHSYCNNHVFPLVRPLARMEARGMKVNLDYLNNLEKDTSNQIDEILEKLQSYPEVKDKGYKVTSNDDLQKILFEEFKFNKGRKTKRGFATDKEVIETLAKETQHPFLSNLQDFKLLKKLHSTYILPYLKSYVKNDGRVHTIFNQHVALTGRLSSENPNLQNIPVRIGPLIMSMFITNPDWVMLLADYNQIELRVMAVASKDPRMIDAFKKGVDIHKATASEMFNIPLDQVDKKQRQDAKAINFGIIYGMTEIGLAQTLECSTDEAKIKRDTYLSRFEGVKEFMDRKIFEYKKHGYVYTMFGKKCFIKGQDENHNEKVAVNAPIQGTASDICTKALMEIDKTIEDENFDMGLIDTIHDSIALEVPPHEFNFSADLIRTIMEGVEVPFMSEAGVALKVDIDTGLNLGAAKEQ